MANLIYFSQPDSACPTCRQWHRAGVLARVSALLAEPIESHDAQQEPALATRMGIQSTPTLLDVSAGYPRLVFPGGGLPQVPSAEELARRVREIRGT